jgi:hypothetical protein
MTRSPPFERLAGVAAILVGLGGLAYGALFVWIVAGSPAWVLKAWFALLLGGAVLTTAVAAGLYTRLHDVEPGLALWGALLGVLGALDGILHGATNLFRLLNPEIGGPGEVVTAGVLRYGAAGIALMAFGWLIVRSPSMPRALGILSSFAGGILVLIFFGRLFQFVTPDVKASLIPPVLYGLLLHPILYVWLGLELRRSAVRV